MEKALLPYQRYFDFEGRSTRTEYFAFSILTTLVYVFLVIVLALSGPNEPGGDMGGMGILAVGMMVMFWIGSLIPTLAVMARRFHDQGRTAWMLLLGLIPYAGGLILLVFMFLSGDEGTNAYGENPR